jgi:hypothetical protein
MIPISPAVASRITWSKTYGCCGYQLNLNSEVVGRLRRPSFWSTRFEAESERSRWIIRRAGFFNSGSEIVDPITQQPVATFKSNWHGGGTLTFSDNQIFQLSSKGLWSRVWTVTAESGQTVMRLQTRGKSVELPPGANLSENRLPLLALFTLYHMLQSEEDAASAVLVATTS